MMNTILIYFILQFQQELTVVLAHTLDDVIQEAFNGEFTLMKEQPATSKL